MILNALALKLKRQARGAFKGRHFEATLKVQSVSWYLRYPLSDRAIGELLLERGLRSIDPPPVSGLPRGTVVTTICTA